MARRRLTQSIDDALHEASVRYNVPYNILRSFVDVESSGNPRAQTGSYKGLFQLSDGEFARAGGRGRDIFDPRANAMAGAALIASHQRQFERQFGREPSLNDLYLIHNQGWGGYLAHAANPDRPAWENMAATREGQERGPEWAKMAVAQNIPGQYLRGRDPETITSREFMEIWNQRMNGQSPDAVGSTEGPVPTQAPFAPTERNPTDMPAEPGFFDHNYPLVHAITGRDAPIGEQLLGDVFGQPGLASNRTASNVGAALSKVGQALTRSTAPSPSALAPIPELPGQDDRAFLLPTPQRRRGLA